MSTITPASGVRPSVFNVDELSPGRIFNFSAGPGVLPEEVIRQAQEDLWNIDGSGIGILEHSHRAKVYDKILAEAEENCRKVANIPANYKVLFLTGGATTQNFMIPANLLPDDGVAAYLTTGYWAEKTWEESKFYSGKCYEAWDGRPHKHAFCPGDAELRYSDAKPAYVHMCSNNTIYGTQWHHLPDVPVGVPLVNDASSDIFCRPVDIARYGMIYGGAQKNLSIAGLTLVIVREDLVGKAPAATPAYLNYATHAKERSLYNTPPVFGIYILHLVLKHLLAEGGLQAVEAKNRRKAAKLYAAIDGSGGYYRGHALPESRSWMNVTFRLPSEELEKKFVAEATADGLDGLKGHRSVGGIRASIYNAFPEAGVDALIAFMADFARKNG